MTLTREDWKFVEKRADDFFGAAYLDCDGYLVALQLARVKKMQLGIIVSVDGKVRFDWMRDQAEDSPALKFYRQQERSLYSEKEKARLTRIIGKRAAKKDPDLNKKMWFWRYYWTDFDALRRHLQKHNSSITILTPDQARERQDTLKETAA